MPFASRTAIPLKMTDKRKQGGFDVDFQVNGETYFLNLAEDERRWEVFVSTETGARPLVVYEDVPEFKNFAVVFEDKKKPRIPN